MIIVFSGKKGSGKDTAAQYYINQGYIKLAFADSLKHICNILFNLSEEQLNGTLKETLDCRYNITPREMFQYIGSLLRNNIEELIPGYGKNIWINIIKYNIENNLALGKNIVITDLRYENEYLFLKSYSDKYKVIFINIKRNNLENKYSLHESEQFNNECDYIIENNGTIEELIDNVKNIIDTDIKT